MKLVRTKVELIELEHRQGELMDESSCGMMLLYMDPDDFVTFRENYNGKAIRLILQPKEQETIICRSTRS